MSIALKLFESFLDPFKYQYQTKKGIETKRLSTSQKVTIIAKTLFVTACAAISAHLFSITMGPGVIAIAAVVSFYYLCRKDRNQEISRLESPLENAKVQLHEAETFLESLKTSPPDDVESKCKDQIQALLEPKIDNPKYCSEISRLNNKMQECSNSIKVFLAERQIQKSKLWISDFKKMPFGNESENIYNIEIQKLGNVKINNNSYYTGSGINGKVDDVIDSINIIRLEKQVKYLVDSFNGIKNTLTFNEFRTTSSHLIENLKKAKLSKPSSYSSRQKNAEIDDIIISIQIESSQKQIANSKQFLAETKETIDSDEFANKCSIEMKDLQNATLNPSNYRHDCIDINKAISELVNLLRDKLAVSHINKARKIYNEIKNISDPDSYFAAANKEISNLNSLKGVHPLNRQTNEALAEVLGLFQVELAQRQFKNSKQVFNKLKRISDKNNYSVAADKEIEKLNSVKFDASCASKINSKIDLLKCFIKNWFLEKDRLQIVQNNFKRAKEFLNAIAIVSADIKENCEHAREQVENLRTDYLKISAELNSLKNDELPAIKVKINQLILGINFDINLLIGEYNGRASVIALIYRIPLKECSAVPLPENFSVCS